MLSGKYQRNLFKRLIIKASRFLFKRTIVFIPDGKDGVFKDGQFQQLDLSDYKIVDKREFLLIPKGRYKVSPRISPNEILKSGEPVGNMVTDNTQESYEAFWGSEEVLEQYLDESRVSFYKEVLKRVDRYITGRVIDVGCGSGDFLRLMKDSYPNSDLYGVDFSQSAIDRCRQNVPYLEFTVGDIYNLSHKSDFFDCVICMEVLEHLEWPATALREIVRICKESGVIIVTVPNGDYDDYIGHLNFWSKVEFEGFLAGLDVLEFKYLEDGKSMLFVLAKPGEGEA